MSLKGLSVGRETIIFFLKYYFLASVLLFLVAMLFYDSLFLAIFFQLMLIPFTFYIKRQYKKLLRERYLLEFRDFLRLLSGFLAAGFSVEKGIPGTLPELRQQWGKDAELVKDVALMERELSLRRPVNVILASYGNESDIREVKLFTEVFSYAKRSGGSLNEIIGRTNDSIMRKIEAGQEIQAMLSSQLLEQRIMSVMPVMILLYVRVFSGDYLESLYGNFYGIVFMTACLFLYLLAVALGVYMSEVKMI